MIRENLEAGRPLPANRSNAVLGLMMFFIEELTRKLQEQYIWAASCSVAVRAGMWGGERRRLRRLKIARMIGTCAVYLGIPDPIAQLPKGWETRGLLYGYRVLDRIAAETGQAMMDIIMAVPRTMTGADGKKVKSSFAEQYLLRSEATMVAKFLELQAAQQVASDRQFDMRRSIMQNLGVTLKEADKNPEYISLEQESRRLYAEADALTGYVIRANLRRMGIEDMVVTGVLSMRDGGAELGRTDVLLSDLCSLRYSGLAIMLGFDLKKADFHIKVEKDGNVLGHIDSDGDFNYFGATDIRTALGWKVATDGGRVRIVDGFDLDTVSKWLLQDVSGDISEDNFRNGYFAKTVKEAFVADKTSRFGDGYCGAKVVLWYVATRQVGTPHDGYQIMY